MTGEGVPSEFAFIERRMHGRVKGLARNSRSRRSYQKQFFLGRLNWTNQPRQRKDLQTRRRQGFWAGFLNALPAFRLVG
jgi:hypothetical protein